MHPIRHEGGGVELLDHGGAADARAGGYLVATVDGPGRAGRPWRRAGGGAGGGRQGRRRLVGRRFRYRHLEVHQLHGVIRELVAEELLVAPVEAADRSRQPIREAVLHVLLVVLLRVAHAQGEPLARCAAQALRLDLAPAGLEQVRKARGEIRLAHR